MLFKYYLKYDDLLEKIEYYFLDFEMVSEQSRITARRQIMPTAEKGEAPLPIALNSKGIRLTDSGKYQEAIELFTQALTLDPSLAGVLYNRAEAKRQSGDSEGALLDLTEALKINPNEPDYLHACGLLAYEDDDFEKALEWYEKALAAEPSSAQVLNDQGVIYFRKGNFSKAKTCFEKALGFDPKLSEAWFNVADTYEELGLRKERAKALESLHALGEPWEDR